MSTTEHAQSDASTGTGTGPDRTPARTTRVVGYGAARSEAGRARGVTRGVRRVASVPGAHEQPARAERPRRGATTAFAACVVAAVAAVTLSGCGIRSTAVPVDAGIPASRTACPPAPGATGSSSADSTGPAVLTTAAPSYVLPGGPTDLPSLPATETPWEALPSALTLPPGPPATGSDQASWAPAAGVSGGSAGPGGSAGSGRTARSAEPTSAAASTPPPPAHSGGFSVTDCPSAGTGAP